MLCKNCGSANIVKIGKSNGKQRYKCKACGKTFIDNENFVGMRTQKHIIAVAMDLYFEGMSVRKIQRQIAYIFKVKVSQVTIYKWIIKYSKLVKEYVETLKVDLATLGYRRNCYQNKWTTKMVLGNYRCQNSFYGRRTFI